MLALKKLIGESRAPLGPLDEFRSHEDWLRTLMQRGYTWFVKSRTRKNTVYQAFHGEQVVGIYQTGPNRGYLARKQE